MTFLDGIALYHCIIAGLLFNVVNPPGPFRWQAVLISIVLAICWPVLLTIAVFAYIRGRARV